MASMGVGGAVPIFTFKPLIYFSRKIYMKILIKQI